MLLVHRQQILITTTNLSNHLKRKHPRIYDDLCTKQNQQQADLINNANKTTNFKQPTIQQVITNAKPWQAQSREALEMNTLVGQMIALDDQPFSIVENVGFKAVMSKALPRYKMPGMFVQKKSLLLL
jgi:hypothetical protein